MGSRIVLAVFKYILNTTGHRLNLARINVHERLLELQQRVIMIEHRYNPVHNLVRPCRSTILVKAGEDIIWKPLPLLKCNDRELKRSNKILLHEIRTPILIRNHHAKVLLGLCQLTTGLRDGTIILPGLPLEKTGNVSVTIILLIQSPDRKHGILTGIKKFSGLVTLTNGSIKDIITVKDLRRLSIKIGLPGTLPCLVSGQEIIMNITANDDVILTETSLNPGNKSIIGNSDRRNLLVEKDRFLHLHRTKKILGGLRGVLLAANIILHKEVVEKITMTEIPGLLIAQEIDVLPLGMSHILNLVHGGKNLLLIALQELAISFCITRVIKSTFLVLLDDITRVHGFELDIHVNTLRPVIGNLNQESILRTGLRAVIRDVKFRLI